MENLHDWISPILTVIGAFIASYLGVRVSIVRLERDYAHLEKEINETLKPRLDQLGERSHDQQQAILRQDGRLMVLEAQSRRGYL